MTDDAREHDEGTGEELLRRALLDAERLAAVALRVDGPVARRRADRHLPRRAGTSARSRPTSPTAATARAPRSRAADLLRVPCDLDLADAERRDEAEDALRRAGARAARRAGRRRHRAGGLARAAGGAAGAATSGSTARSSCRSAPAHRLMPVALVAPERHLIVAPVCGARTLAEGRPPLGIACAQQDVAHVYPLPDDPERCLEDFAERAAAHAHASPSASTTRTRPSGASWSSTGTTSRRPADATRPCRRRRIVAVSPLGRARLPGRLRRLWPAGWRPRSASAAPGLRRCCARRRAGDATGDAASALAGCRARPRCAAADARRLARRCAARPGQDPEPPVWTGPRTRSGDARREPRRLGGRRATGCRSCSASACAAADPADRAPRLPCCASALLSAAGALLRLAGTSTALVRAPGF